MYAIGVDLGGTKISFGIISQDGALSQQHRISTPGSWDEIKSSIIDAVKDYCENADVIGLGFGCAGMVDHSGFVHYSPNVPAFKNGVAVQQELNDALNIPVLVDNDNNCAGLGEYVVSEDKVSKNIIYIGLGTGIGGAIIIEGSLVRGDHGYAGDVGHFTTDPNGPLCACGNHGCFEALASGTALRRIAREFVERGEADSVLEEAGGNIDKIDGELIGKVARAGGDEALAILDEYSKNIAVGVIGLVNIFDPGLIIIGGGVVQLGEMLFSPLRKHIANMAQGGYSSLTGSVVPARLGENAGVIGAGLMALNSFSRDGLFRG